MYPFLENNQRLEKETNQVTLASEQRIITAKTTVSPSSGELLESPNKAATRNSPSFGGTGVEIAGSKEDNCSPIDTLAAVNDEEWLASTVAVICSFVKFGCHFDLDS